MRNIQKLGLACAIALGGAGCAHDDPFLKALLTAPSSEPEKKDAPDRTQAIDYRYCQACLLDANGKEVVVSTTLKGDLERAELRDGQIVLTGWGADMAAGKPAKLALLISDAGVVASAVPSLARPDIGSALSLYKTVTFGFEISAPADKVGNAAVIWLVAQDGKAARMEKVFRR